MACNAVDFTLDTSSFNLNTNNNPALNINFERNNINHGCNYFAVINYGSASTYSARSLTNGSYNYPIQIYKDAGHTLIIKDLADATSSSDVIDGVFPEGSGSITNTQVYRPSIDPTTYTRFGSYSDTFTIRLYEGTLSSNVLRRTRTVTLTYTQPKKIDLSLVDTSAAFNIADTTQTLNFGNLTTGAVKAFDLILGYNAGYSLQLSSANNGKLKHASLPTTINYALTVNGANVNLSSGPASVSSNTGVSPAGGLRLPISATIGSIAGKDGGNYSDTITVSVTSIE